jgi:hypothetical protein
VRHQTVPFLLLTGNYSPRLINSASRVHGKIVLSFLQILTELRHCDFCHWDNCNSIWLIFSHLRLDSPGAESGKH